MFRSSQKGFTLIELMVAITIIAILSAIGLTIYSTAQRSARDGKRIGDMQEIQKAMEQYYAVHRDYSDAATIYSIGGADPLTKYFSEGTVPVDPTVGNYTSFVCNLAGSGSNSYRVCAKMENPQSGNRGANVTGCTDAISDGSRGYYCVGSLSE